MARSAPPRSRSHLLGSPHSGGDQGRRGCCPLHQYISTSASALSPQHLQRCRDAEMQGAECGVFAGGELEGVPDSGGGETRMYQPPILAGTNSSSGERLSGMSKKECPSAALARSHTRHTETSSASSSTVSPSRHPTDPRNIWRRRCDDNGTLLHTSRSSTGDAASPPLRSLLFTLLLSVLPRLPSPCTGQNAWRDSPGIVEKILMHVVTDYLEVTSKASVFPSPTSVRGAAQDHSSRSAHCPCSTTNRW